MALTKAEKDAAAKAAGQQRAGSTTGTTTPRGGSTLGIDIPPPPAGESDYIGGFPSDYTVKASRPGASVAMQPRYHVGDEWRPLRNSWTPAQIADLQAKMVAAGLLDKASYQRGSWDNASRQAYLELLTQSNAAGRDAGSMLNVLQQNTKMFGKPGKQKVPFQPQVSDPEDIKATVRATMVKTLGRQLGDDEINLFVANYQQLQRDTQRHNYEISGAGDPESVGVAGDLRQPPSAESFVESQLWKQRPGESGAHELRGHMEEFKSLLGGVI